jgi:hypothetical protein
LNPGNGLLLAKECLLQHMYEVNKKGDVSGEARWRGLDWQNETEREVVGLGRQKRDKGVSVAISNSDINTDWSFKNLQRPTQSTKQLRTHPSLQTVCPAIRRSSTRQVCML